MSGNPTVTFVRNVDRLPSGQTLFVVAASITNPGDLPYPELFVVTITDVDNPKTDTLARVVTPFELRQIGGTDPLYVKVDSASVTVIDGDPFARIASVNDLTGLARDRTTAVQRGQSEYLTTAITLTFDTLPTADAAWKQILKRLSDLVTTWRSYRNDFATTPSTSYPLPQTAAGVEAERTAVYVTARDATALAEDARDAARVALDAEVAECAFEKRLFDVLASDVAFLERARQLVTARTEVVTTTLNLTGGTTLTSPGTYTITQAVVAANSGKAFALDGSDPASYEALLVTKRAAYTSQRATVVACDATVAGLRDALGAAESVVTTAQASETAALASVLAVCPTFDPTSV